MEKDTLVNTTSANSSNGSLFSIIGIIIIVVIIYLINKAKKNNTPSDELPLVLDKTNTTNKEVTKVSESSNKSQISKNIPSIQSEEEKPIVAPIKSIETKAEVIIKEEEPIKEKYIGYNPINIFAQTEPNFFPYVVMPKPNCVIKFPRKGRTGRKGFKEEEFKGYIDTYFKNDYQIFDDRFILIKNNSRPYEPDFTLVNEKEGINIFVDIEIDEPYEGTNDIENRKTTHCKYSDSNRNNAFTSRGWIVIRFAEIQIHQQPDACCKFIAHILKSIQATYQIPQALQIADKIVPVPQWTEEEAKEWSLTKYRESYLGINSFGSTTNGNEFQEFEETELGEVIEEQIEDVLIQNVLSSKNVLTSFHKLFMASSTGKYVSFIINNDKIIFKPTNVNDHETSGFCYVKNEIRSFLISDMENVEVKDNYHTIKLTGPTIGVAKIADIVNTVIEYDKYIRMKYTRAAWNNMLVDTETGELVLDVVEAEESTRTVSNVQLAINALDEEHIEAYRLNSNYLTAYCHKREEQRTFRFDRIGEVEILDI